MRHPTALVCFAAVATVLATTTAATPDEGREVRSAGSRASTQIPPPRQWGSLERGRYGVGFRLLAEYDHSRRIAPAVDFDGRRTLGPLAMPLPIAVWYPAAPGPRTPGMQYGSFAALGVKRTDLTPVTPADRRAAVESMRAFAGFAFGRQIPESLMRTVDTTTTAAVQDAAPARGRFPVVLAAMDGSIAAATVLFEYLASHGIVVMAVPSRLSYATLQVSRPNVVVEARVRDLEFLLDHARGLSFVDTDRIAVLGVNFDGMAALAFQMKNMAAHAVVSLDGWEGKANSIVTVSAGLHYDARRLRVPYLVVLQDEQSPPPGLRLDRAIFDALRYSTREWLVLRSMSHAYLIANPLAYPDVPPDKRASYELLVRGVHGFLAAAVGDSASPLGSQTGGSGIHGGSAAVKDAVRVEASAAVPDDTELERLIMVDRAVDKVAGVLRDARRSDSTFQLFSEQTMALYAFRFTRQNERPFALRLLALNAEAFPRSAGAADALGDGYRDVGDTTKALALYSRALELLGGDAPNDASSSQARQAVTEKVGRLRRP